MADGMKQPRDENGRFASLRDYIEDILRDDRGSHDEVHNVEHAVAKETAQRLERQVETSAVRVEEGVKVALRAVAETARIHSEAHAREHLAHERIHAVEKEQVDKAEELKSAEAIRVASDLKEYKTASNEWRAALGDQSSKFVAREMFDQRADNVDKRLAGLEKAIVGREAFSAALESRDHRIDELENFRSKALGFGALVSLLSGIAGALILKALGG